MINELHTKEKCKDDISKIPNYEKAIADTTKVWHCHHIWEISMDGENELHSQEELIRLGMYYKRPYYELIFLTPSDHRKLHHRTIEARKRNSEQQKKVDRKGSKNPMAGRFGKDSPQFGRKRSKETCEKIAKAQREAQWRKRNGIR